MKILAAIVTYNRAELLERCINALLKQIRLPDEILIVNNGSTDNTEEVISKKCVKQINQDNSGSAGGWNTAINYALKENFDYIWLMDDDGFPEKKALQTLINLFDDRFSCLSSIVVSEDDDSKFVFSYPLMSNKGAPKSFKFWVNYKKVKELPILEDFYYPFAHLFNGALIKIDAVKKIGNVNKDYFMYGDEVDYFFRLQTEGIVASTPKAIHYHPNVLGRRYSIQRIYYNIKNNIINYFKYYNLPYLRSIIGPLVILRRILITNGFIEVLNLIGGKNSKIFYRAIINGFRMKIKKDFKI